MARLLRVWYPDVTIPRLEKISPMTDEVTRQEIATLTAKGFAGTVFLTTDDCMKAYEEMSARGVEFTEKPTVQPYGVDAGFRDPSGNSIRLTQRTPMV